MVAKGVTVYAQWKIGTSNSVSNTISNSGTNKNSNRVLTEHEKKMVGTWRYTQYTSIGSLTITYQFNNDGTYLGLTNRASYDNRGRVSYTNSYTKSDWSISGNTIYFTNREYSTNNNNWDPLGDTSLQLRMGSDENGQYFFFDDTRKAHKI